MLVAPPSPMLMTIRCPSGEKRGENVMPGKLPRQVALAGVQVHEEHARLVAGVLHVGDILGRGAEARGEHQLAPLAQQPHVGAVLVHHGQPLAAALLRAGLVDEDDLRVEIALLAGEALVDLVGDEMPQPAPLLRGDDESLRGELTACEHVPEAELADHPPVRRPSGPADHERLGVDHPPVLEARRRIEIARAVDEGGPVERLEQARALEIGRNHIGDLAPELGILAQELRYGDWDGLQRALGDVDLERTALGRPGRQGLLPGRGRPRPGRRLLRLAVGAGQEGEKDRQDKAGNLPQKGLRADPVPVADAAVGLIIGLGGGLSRVAPR